MKKGIILVITLIFIGSFSLIILKTLTTNDSYIQEASFNTKLKQFQLINRDIHQEVIQLITKYKDNTPLLLTSLKDFSFSINDHKVLIQLVSPKSNTSNCDLNKITDVKSFHQFCTEEVISNIGYPYDFLYLLSQLKGKYKEISNQDQVDFFINHYIEKTKDSQIKLARDWITYTSIDSMNKLPYIGCKYKVLTKDIQLHGNFIFDPNSNQTLNKKVYLVKNKFNKELLF